MLTTLHRVAAVGLIWLDLDLEVLESNNFTEKRSVGKLGSLSFGFRILLASSDKKELGVRCSMLTALCPPIHREIGVSAKKLDDGWPESVEEQGLLLLVWRHHITKHNIKRCVIRSRKEEYQDNIAQVQDSSLHRIFCIAFHTQNFLQRDAFTHRCF